MDMEALASNLASSFRFLCRRAGLEAISSMDDCCWALLPNCQYSM